MRVADMSLVSEIRETLNMIARLSDPAWRAEFRAQVAGIQQAAAELQALYQAELAERKTKPKPPKPPKPSKRKPVSPDADTVGTVKNMRPRRPFVHSVPPASLPRGHR